MTTKIQFEDIADEGPDLKLSRGAITDCLATDHGNVLTVKENENIISKSIRSYDDSASNVDGIGTFKSEPFEIKDEKPLVYELPTEFDEVDPLRPLKTEEVKHEPSQEKVKTECVDGYDENDANDDGSQVQGHEEASKPPDTFRTIDDEDQSIYQAFKQLLASKLRPNGVEQPSTPHENVTFPERKKEESMTTTRIVSPKSNMFFGTVQELEIKNHTEPYGEPQSGTKMFVPSKDVSTPNNLGGKPVTTKKNECDESKTSVIVQLLVESHFLMNNRTKKQEHRIIRAGRPTPFMASSPNESQGEFWANAREYQLIPWLTGLKKLLKYFCWPCLLFTKERWSLQGGKTEKEFWDTVNQHAEDPLHQVAYKNLKLRESKLKDYKLPESNPKNIVKMNRTLLAILIRILGTKKTKLNNTESNFDGYEELMKVAVSYNPEFQLCLREPKTFDGLVHFVSRHAKKLLSSMQAILSIKIHDEISNIPFVSIIYEDTASIVDKSTLVAVILRFVTENGDICERFLKFVKLGPSRNAFNVLETHVALIEEFGLREKLVGYTFSGSVLAPTSMREFDKVISKVCPKAKFFHHSDSNLKELLLQSLSHLKECQRFLAVISDVVKFLMTNSGALPTLVTFIRHNQPNCQGLDGVNSFTCDIICTIKRYYPHIIQFFFQVSHKFWNDEVTGRALVFMNFLQEPFNRFLIAVVGTLLDTVDDLGKAMEKDYRPENLKAHSANVLENLNQLGVNYFLYLASNDQMQPSAEQFILAGMPKYCPEVFIKIVETSTICIHHRVGNAGAFYVDSNIGDILESPEIWRRYGLQLNTLEELNEHIKSFDVCISSFDGKSIPEIVKAVANLEKTPEVQLLWDFLRFCALTISPYKSSKSKTSAVLRLKSYLKDKQELNPIEVLMFLEKSLLRSQLKNSEFIEEVITHYAEKNNERNFLYDFSGTGKLEFMIK